MYSLKVINEEVIGLVKIKENSQFNKLKAEKVVIDENITARIFGTANTIVLKKGAKLFFHGVILGGIKNNGGEIFIFDR